jgi:hypothetical protein
MLSQPMSWHLCGGGERVGAPAQATGSGLAITNVLGTGVQLNSDGLDPTNGLVAVDAARMVSRGRLVVIEK